MLAFEEVDGKQCRFPITDAPPHYFCGERTDGRSYCPEHDALCHAGQGKPWESLAGMIDAVEQTVSPTPRRMADVAVPADDALKSKRLDKPLMRRL